ncbi:MAG: hypothetical protein ACYCOU_02905 [Sulfobacillus sp.]
MNRFTPRYHVLRYERKDAALVYGIAAGYAIVLLSVVLWTVLFEY